MIGYAMILMVFWTTTLLGADRETIANGAVGEFTYIVVLHDRAPADGSDRGTPDIVGLGGKVLHQWHNRRVVRMPEAALHSLKKHRAVKYIQRIQMAGELPPETRPEVTENAAVIAADWAPPSWSSGRYVYDGDGNITAIGTTANPASDAGTETYAYDAAGRLVSAAITHGAAHSEQYTYDSFGNLVNTARTAGPSTATPASVANNRLTGYTYDSVGNLTAEPGLMTEYIYDAFNMIRAKGSSSGGAFYVYTADDERIGAAENGEQRWMVRDLSGRVLREWEGNSGWWVWREDYIYRNGALVAGERDPAEGGTRHLHVDHLGTPRMITDGDGAKIALHDYFPFGVEITDFRQEMFERGTDRPEPMKFTGHERDFTAGIEMNNRNQLDYMHARYYSPVWGRFLSVDPGRDWDIQRPQSWNMYSYARNSPILYVDADGRVVTIVIKRDTYTSESVTSKISVTSDVKGAGSFDGYTLENAKAGSKGDKDPIAPGAYDAFLRTDHDPDRIELKDVPNFQNVQIHIGNDATDVIGCFAVGETRSENKVSSSTDALNAILEIIENDGSDVITVTVEGASTKPADDTKSADEKIAKDKDKPKP